MKKVSYFAHYDQQSGHLLSYYQSTSRFIPRPSIEISQEDWQIAQTIEANYLIDGELVHQTPPEDERPIRTILWK